MSAATYGPSNAGQIIEFKPPSNATGSKLETVATIEAYYDAARQLYLIRDARNGWVMVNETAIKRHLKQYHRTKPKDDSPLSELEMRLNEIQTESNVAFAGPLAGTKPGLIEYDGRLILVTEGPRFLPSVPGSWPTLGAVIENVLRDEVADQRPYFYSWLKIAREALREGMNRPGQALCMAGPHDCGKSLLQGLITPLLGGRSAKPYGWMTGATDFNGDLFGAEHLMIEDEVSTTDNRSRRIFGARLKEVTVNAVQRCHAKNRTAVTLSPFWRLTITVNDEPENLMVLPPIDDSIEDKLILLRANKRPMPMPTTTHEQRAVFMGTLQAELPAFCAYLDGWEIPAGLRSERFGIRHYHHPELLRAIDDLAPEIKLLRLIEDAGIVDADQWTGSANELERKLRNIDAHTADRLFSYNTACGVYLGRLARKRPDRIDQNRTKNGTKWTIKRQQVRG